MLRASITFFILALVAILFGATGFAGVSLQVGHALMAIFLILAAISFVAYLIVGTRYDYLP